MLRRYETLILTVPEITEDESKSLESGFDRVVKAVKGSVVSFERWGKYRLSYPVRNNDYGIYYLVRFETEDTKVLEDVKSLLAVRFNDFVMRHMVAVLDAKQSLAYQKPPSLEDAPARDVNTFLKENKMEGLMSGDAEGHGAFDDQEEVQ